MKKILLVILTLLFKGSFAQVDSTGLHYDSCNFEYSFEHISLQFDSSSTNIWQIGNPQKQVFQASFSDSLAIVTDTVNSYPDTNSSGFLMKIPLDFEGSIVLSFLHKIHSDTLKDGGYIEASYDNGNSWSNVVYDSVFYASSGILFFSENLYNRGDSLVGDHLGFSGTSDWVRTKLQWIFWLPLRDIFTDTLMLRFKFISDSINTNKDGWIIDDFMVSRFSYCCGLNENVQDDLIIFPNPAEESITIKTNGTFEVGELFLCDVLGNRISYSNLNETIDISHLDSGLYFLEFKTTKGLIRRSFVKK